MTSKPSQDRNQTALHPSKRELLETLLLSPSTSGLTVKEIAARAGVSVRSVSYARRRIAEHLARTARKGEVVKHLRSGQIIETLGKPSALDPNGGLTSAQVILDAFSDAEILTPDQSMRLFSVLAQYAPPAIQVQALTKLDDMRLRHKPPASLGPPVPLTEEEKVSRLARLIECCGADITLKATQQVFGVMNASVTAQAS